MSGVFLSFFARGDSLESLAAEWRLLGLEKDGNIEQRAAEAQRELGSFGRVLMRFHGVLCPFFRCNRFNKRGFQSSL